MTDHAYVALIDAPQQFDQVEDFIAALVREGAGYANDIGVLDVKNHFDRDSLLVLFTADRGLVDACFHLEFGFGGPVRFEHLDAFETDGDEEGVEIVGFRSLADEAGDAADSPEKVFAYVRALQRLGPGQTSRRACKPGRRTTRPRPTGIERLAEMLPVATSGQQGGRQGRRASRPGRRPAKASKASKKPASKKAARGKKASKGNQQEDQQKHREQKAKAKTSPGPGA